MNIAFLKQLTRRRWAVGVLAEIAGGTMARLPVLCARLGASHTGTREAIEHLCALGLLARNAGHGHPLRPEFVLTPRGKAVAKAAGRIWSWADDPRMGPLLPFRWTLPVLYCVKEPLTYGEIRKAVTPVTDRALSISLKQLTEAKALSRRVETASRPPLSLYTPLPPALKIGGILRNVGAA